MMKRVDMVLEKKIYIGLKTETTLFDLDQIRADYLKLKLENNEMKLNYRTIVNLLKTIQSNIFIYQQHYVIYCK